MTFSEVSDAPQLFHAYRLSELNTVHCATVVWTELWLLLAIDYQYAVSNQYQSFLCHLYCIAGKTRGFPNLKINTNCIFFLFFSLLMTRVCGWWIRIIDSLANQDLGLSTFIFICSSKYQCKYGRWLLKTVHQHTQPGINTGWKMFSESCAITVTLTLNTHQSDLFTWHLLWWHTIKLSLIQKDHRKSYFDYMTQYEPSMWPWPWK